MDKGFKIRIALLATLILVVFIAIGIIAYNMGDTDENDILSVETIVKTFHQEGLPLSKDDSKLSDTYEIGGIEPNVYKIGETNDHLLIYIFKSFVDREDIIRESDEFNNRWDVTQISYNAKNTFMVYLPSIDWEHMNENEMKNWSETVNSISTIVFKNLNEGKEIAFKGESASWEGEITLKYYEHWWVDENEKHHYDSYHYETPVLRYKNSYPEDVGPIEYDLETNSSKGSGSGMTPDKDGYVSLGHKSGSGSFPRKDDVYDFTIKWNDKEESFTLEAQ